MTLNSTYLSCMACTFSGTTRLWFVCGSIRWFGLLCRYTYNCGTWLFNLSNSFNNFE